MQWHSGAKPDKPEAGARLKQISRPHTLLSATEQRDHAEAASGARSRSHPGGFETLDAFGKV
ncbi:hypothetical protein [Falsiroseomonas sp.]|uniref:hypothetical protein n=1 Tax=Falsiroseomonas sp. TaxID=2870721 RepID=UPI002735975E|nr:hypothetical protein [Falsiroseomonas sp.]MDP3417232.1 hypothetical protein [Falsiroseomonas sp.]